MNVLRLPSMRQCLQLHLLHLWEFAVLTPAQVDSCLRIVDGVEEEVEVGEARAHAELPPRQSGADAVSMQVVNGDRERMAVEQTEEARASV